MTNLKEMILKMKEQAMERVNSINGKQSAIITLMKELKDLFSSSKAMAKEYEEMGTMLLNMADDLRGQAEDVSDWAMYDVCLEDEDDEEEEDDDEDDGFVECDNCGKQVDIDDIIYDDYGWGFCCDECKENCHQECDDEEDVEKCVYCGKVVPKGTGVMDINGNIFCDDQCADWYKEERKNEINAEENGN